MPFWISNAMKSRSCRLLLGALSPSFIVVTARARAIMPSGSVTYRTSVASVTIPSSKRFFRYLETSLATSGGNSFGRPRWKSSCLNPDNKVRIDEMEGRRSSFFPLATPSIDVAMCLANAHMVVASKGSASGLAMSPGS